MPDHLGGWTWAAAGEAWFITVEEPPTSYGAELQTEVE